MTSSRQNKHRNSRRAPIATSNKRNFTGSMPLSTSVNTPSTASTMPVQQASLVDQISDLSTLPNKSNASLEEQLKQQQLLIDKITSHINALESHVELLEGKIAIQETVSNLLEQKTDDLEAYSEDHAQFYQEFRNQRKSRRGYQKISSCKSPENWSSPRKNREER